jgi:ABC-2 type transport system ATP-binding protein
MRCELAAALLHSPEIVFLDEPTIGLDLLAKEGIRRFLLEENRRRGTTLILTTHDLSDIEELCERVMIIDHGRLLFDGLLGGLKKLLGGEGSLIFHLLNHSQGESVPPAAEGGQSAPPSGDVLSRLAELTRGRPVSWSAEGDAAFRATFDPTAVPRAEIIRGVLDRFEVADIAFAEVKIEDVIRGIYERARERAAT